MYRVCWVVPPYLVFCDGRCCQKSVDFQVSSYYFLNCASAQPSMSLLTMHRCPHQTRLTTQWHTMSLTLLLASFAAKSITAPVPDCISHIPPAPPPHESRRRPVLVSMSPTRTVLSPAKPIPGWPPIFLSALYQDSIMTIHGQLSLLLNHLCIALVIQNTFRKYQFEKAIPASTRHWTNVVLMLDWRRMVLHY